MSDKYIILDASWTIRYDTETGKSWILTTRLHDDAKEPLTAKWVEVVEVKES